jgi:hypothetical protein
MSPDLQRMRNTVERLEANSAMAMRFNIPAMKAALDAWPVETPIGTPLAKRLQLGVPRALATARFIQMIEGSNDI